MKSKNSIFFKFITHFLFLLTNKQTNPFFDSIFTATNPFLPCFQHIAVALSTAVIFLLTCATQPATLTFILA